jgi:hypothetical protein
MARGKVGSNEAGYITWTHVDAHGREGRRNREHSHELAGAQEIRGSGEVDASNGAVEAVQLSDPERA